jgi:hypothetical protein
MWTQSLMQVFTAQIIEGTIVPDHHVDLPEGSRVTVVAVDSAVLEEVTDEEEKEWLESLAPEGPGDPM